MPVIKSRYSIFVLLITCSCIFSCEFDISENRNNQSKKDDQKKDNVQSTTSTETKNEIKPEQELDLGYIIYDQLPTTIQEQIEGAGCGFSFTPNGESFMINGLIRINGLYELLEANNDAGSDDLMIYENNRWEMRFYLDKNRNEEEGSLFGARMTLRNKKTGQKLSKKAFGSCGC